MAKLEDKPLVWLKGEVKTPPFGERARIEAGFLLRRLQQGRSPEFAALPANAGDLRTVPRIENQRQEPDVEDCVSPCAGCRGNPRCFQQEDRNDASRDAGRLSQAVVQVSESCIGKGARLMMKDDRRIRLERAGWVVGNAEQFLNLSPEEAQFVELKLALAAGVRQLRERRGLTQVALARQLGSSQSRVAKMEAADGSVSVDLMLRSLLAIGATPGDIAKLIKRVESHRAA